MKKVLSFVLVLSLVLSSFSMAFAGSSTELKTLSDIAGNKNEEAIEVNYDLGIITGNPDGTFQPEKAVTRAEFAAMITRALAIPQSALAGYASTNFKDTNGYSWAVPYLAFCNSKGIMLGDGAGNAMPGKTITVNEAVTMALRAIGYTANSSELTGVWPSNYVTKAQELELYDDVAKDATGVDKANAAQVIYNTLTVQKVAVNSDGKTEKLWDKYDDKTKEYVETTLLSSGLNCTKEDKAVVEISDIEDSVINMAKHIGRYGNVYKNDGGKGDIVAFIPDSEQLVGRFTEADTFVTTADSKEYSLKTGVTTIGALLANNASDKTKDATITDAAVKFGMDGRELVLNVDLSGKTIKEIYSAVEWTVKAGQQVDADDIAEIKDDQELLGFDFVLDDNDEIDYTQFALVGVNSIKDIKADNVVYVYADKEKEIRRIEVGTEVAEGIIKTFREAKSDVATTFAIGANTYKNANEVVNGVDALADDNKVTDKEVSETVKAALDARGFVFDFDSTDSVDNYAVVIDKNTTFNKEVKVLLADGNEKVLTVDEKDDFAALTKGAVFGYALNKDGEISEIDQTTNGAFENVMTTTAGAVKVNFPTNKVINFDVDTAGENATSTATISKDVVVFTFDGTDYDTTTIDKVEKKADQKQIGATVLFAEDDTTEVVAIIVDSAMAKGGDKAYAVVSEKNRDVNADEDRVWHIVGYKDGEKLDALTDDGSGLFKDWATPVYKTSNGFGDTVNVYEVKVDANGVITTGDKVEAGGDIKIVKGNVTEANGRDSVKLDTAGFTGLQALSDKVVIYEVSSDEYDVYKGSLKKGDFVTLYEVDDDEEGFDIVIFARP
ncbi:MAG: S-layer homology domain-containing protein [Aminipila sp.]